MFIRALMVISLFFGMLPVDAYAHSHHTHHRHVSHKSAWRIRYDRTPSVSYAAATDPVDCIADAIYHEAPKGKANPDRAIVAKLVVKRMTDHQYPQSICGVVHQRNPYKGRIVCQFDWYCKSDLRRVHEFAEFEKAREVARETLQHVNEVNHWKVEYISGHCIWDHRDKVLIVRTRAQCYLGKRHHVT